MWGDRCVQGSSSCQGCSSQLFVQGRGSGIFFSFSIVLLEFTVAFKIKFLTIMVQTGVMSKFKCEAFWIPHILLSGAERGRGKWERGWAVYNCISSLDTSHNNALNHKSLSDTLPVNFYPVVNILNVVCFWLVPKYVGEILLGRKFSILQIPS